MMLPKSNCASRASALSDPRTHPRRPRTASHLALHRSWRILVVALLIALVGQGTFAGASPAVAEAQGTKPKAVIIVGPTHGSTPEYLSEGETFAAQATAAGMEVATVFHPYATWERVVNETTDANLVVYFGHGNGWPSPYAPFQESTKNGFGLNPTAGGSANSVSYMGGTPIRQNLRLADNAVVIIYLACYAAGNGERGQPYPTTSVAVERVDNFAAAFLHPKVGAAAVFAFWTKQWVDFSAELMRADRTMERILRTPSDKPGWYTSGWVGDDPIYADSTRTDGARMLLDRHSTRGFSRALSGDLEMTTDEWRTEASDPEPAPDPEPTPTPKPSPTPQSTPSPTPDADPTPAPTSEPTRAPTGSPDPRPSAYPPPSLGTPPPRGARVP